MCIYVCVCVCIYTYIYRERERNRDREKERHRDRDKERNFMRLIQANWHLPYTQQVRDLVGVAVALSLKAKKLIQNFYVAVYTHFFFLWETSCGLDNCHLYYGE